MGYRACAAGSAKTELFRDATDPGHAAARSPGDSDPVVRVPVEQAAAPNNLF